MRVRPDVQQGFEFKMTHTHTHTHTAAVILKQDVYLNGDIKDTLLSFLWDTDCIK